MILKLFRRTPQEGTIACLYGTMVARARLPALYQKEFQDQLMPGNFLKERR
jgi:hypothetical protein